MGFETILLPSQPCLLRYGLRLHGVSRGTEVVGHMSEVQQIAALAAKALSDLLGYPRPTVTHTVHPVASAKPRPRGAGAQWLAHNVHIAQQGRSRSQLLAACHMGQADFSLLPLHALAFSPVALSGSTWTGRHHAAVHFGYECLPRRDRLGQHLGQASAALLDGLAVLQADPSDGALGDHDPIVFDHLVHRLGVRQVRPQLSQCAAQAPQTAFGAEARALGKGRILLVPLGYCSSSTLILTKLVCQWCFFTLAVRPPAVAYLLLGLAHLAQRPALHGLLAQSAYLLAQPMLRIVSPLEIPLGVFHHRQQCSHPALDLRMSP